MEEKGVNVAARPPEGGPAEAGGAFRPEICHRALTVQHGSQTVRVENLLIGTDGVRESRESMLSADLMIMMIQEYLKSFV